MSKLTNIKECQDFFDEIIKNNKSINPLTGNTIGIDSHEYSDVYKQCMKKYSSLYNNTNIPKPIKNGKQTSVSKKPASPVARAISPSPAATKRAISPSPAATKRAISPSPVATKRTISPSPVATKRSVSPVKTQVATTRVTRSSTLTARHQSQARGTGKAQIQRSLSPPTKIKPVIVKKTVIPISQQLPAQSGISPSPQIVAPQIVAPQIVAKNASASELAKLKKLIKKGEQALNKLIKAPRSSSPPAKSRVSPKKTKNTLEYNNEIIKLVEGIDEKTCLQGMKLPNNIKIDKIIGQGGFGKINLTIGENDLKFATKFLEVNDFNTRELAISKFLSNKNQHFLTVYKTLTCPIADKFVYPNYLNYYMILCELVDGSLDKLKYDDYNLNNSIFYQSILCILLFHTTLYNDKKMFHNDTYTRNFLYKKIEPGGYFKYIINGQEVFVKNEGYLVILWDFAGTVTDIDINSNFAIVPHTGKKIYFDDDYMILIKDLIGLSNDPMFSVLLKNYSKSINIYKNKSENDLWDLIIKDLLKLYNKVLPTDKIISETIIDIPYIDRPELYELKNPKMDIMDLQKVKGKLLKVLDSSRQTIRSREDIFLDDEHKLMCEKVIAYKNKDIKTIKSPDTKVQYDKYKGIKNDILKYIVEKNLTIKYGYFTFMYLNEYIPKDYTFKLNYNKYNKKFFNRLNYNFNKEIITNFIIKQIDFINRIDVKERLILRDYVHGYTFFGIITKYENGNLTLNDIVKTIKDRGLPNKYPPFVYILDKVLREHGSSLVDPDPNKIKLELIDILYDKGYKLQNAISFDIWKETLDLYMKELTEIFTKAPKTEDEIVLYRGAGLNYIGPGAKKGFYTLNRFTSATMDSNVALKYADKYDRDKALIYRITIPKGIPLIFVEPFNEGVKELVEVLIPKGCIFYIERGIKQIDIYDDRKNICPLKSRTVKILDIRLVSYIPPSE